MSKAHWDEWLSDARAEKKKRQQSGTSTKSTEVPSLTIQTEYASSEDSVDPRPAWPKSHTEKARVPSPTKKKSGLNKKSIKSINRLVKKQEADASIGVLKDALEHLWTNVIEGTNANRAAAAPVPVQSHPLATPTIDTAFDNPPESARSLLLDIQARINSHNPADKEGYNECCVVTVLLSKISVF